MFSPHAAFERGVGQFSLSAFQFIERVKLVGSRLQNWLAYPDPRRATRPTLTIPDLLSDGKWEILSDDVDFHLELDMLGLPSVFPICREYTIMGNFPRPGEKTLPTCLDFQGLQVFDLPGEPARPVVYWNGIVGLGVLHLSIVQRIPSSEFDVPFISQICQAVCQHEHVLQELRHVFMSTIVNFETLNVVHALHGTLPDLDTHRHVWSRGTATYQALLGTPLGKIVGHFAIDAFEPRTRTISQIVTWYDRFDVVSMRFDIDVVGNAVC